MGGRFRKILGFDTTVFVWLLLLASAFAGFYPLLVNYGSMVR